MKINMIEPGAVITKEEIENFEKRFGQRLPEDYVKFLLLSNGGYSDEYRMDYEDAQYKDKQTAVIYHWFALGGSRKSPTRILGIEEAMRNMRDRLPTGLLPIASDDGGDVIVLSVRDADRGAVLFFSSEAPLDKSLSKLSTSFTAFLDKLKLTRKRA
jgi:hypothetical protein